MDNQKADTRESRAAFQHAVSIERAAIKLHETAAKRQGATADTLEKRAALEADDLTRRRTLDRAAKARIRAQLARHRAEQARDRLRDEGIEPDLT